jgi:hypothetical protein
MEFGKDFELGFGLHIPNMYLEDFAFGGFLIELSHLSSGAILSVFRNRKRN